jgi:hypothetical protein
MDDDEPPAPAPEPDWLLLASGSTPMAAHMRAN